MSIRSCSLQWGPGSEMTEDSTVLFVDEDQDFLDLSTRLLELETEGVDIVPESSPGQVPDRLASEQVDCVVSDYCMNEMDGLELLRAIRETHPQLPFILFTARGGEDIASDAITSGATDYVVKTGSPEQYTILANCIDNAVTHRRMAAQTAQRHRTNAVLRIITRELVDKTTREQIEATVCSELVDIDPYAFALVSRVDSGSDRLEPTVWETAPDVEVDAERLTDAISASTHAPEYEADATGFPSHVVDIESRADSQWHSRVGVSPLSAVVAVPVGHTGVSYGVLSVYATEPDVFDSAERTALADLGGFVGYALNTATLRQKVFSTGSTEIELEVQDTSVQLLQFADALDSPVLIDNVLARANGTYTVALRIEDGPTEERIRDAIDAVLAPYEVEQTGHQDGAERWVVRVDECPVAVFAEHGIELTRVSLTGQRGQIVLNASPEVDTRELVELAEQEFAAVELTRRQTRSIQQQDRPALDSLADLTPRQREVLKTAYQSGFFESPRQMNTEDIASLLDISQPAVSRHLRNIQQTIFERVVDDISVSPAEETD